MPSPLLLVCSLAAAAALSVVVEARPAATPRPAPQCLGWELSVATKSSPCYAAWVNLQTKCANGTRTFDANCCPTCKFDPPACVPTTVRACLAANLSTIDTCALGVVPHTDTNCCPSCVPRAASICNDTEIAACPTPPACASGQHPELNRTTCCRSCRNIGVAAPSADVSKCTPDNVKTCLSTLTGPDDVCEDGERPRFDSASCCATCRPVEVAVCASRKALVEARAASPVCVDGLRPAFLRDENTNKPLCNFTCHYNRQLDAVCNPPCGATEHCVDRNSWKNTTVDPVCVPSVWRSFDLMLSDAVKASAANWNASDFEELVAGIVASFCEMPNQANRCKAFEVHAANVIVRVDRKCDASNGTCKISLRIPTSPPPPKNGKRAAWATGDDAPTFMSDAMTNSTATGSTDVSAHVDNAATTAQLSLAAVLLSLVLLFVM